MSDVFGRIDASCQALLAALHGAPDTTCEQANAVGEWSIKNVLGHVAFWKGAIAQRAERVVAGGALDDGSGPGEHWQVTNVREAARRATWTLQQVLAELESEHMRAVAALRRVPANDLEHVMADFIDHSDEHAARISAWRLAADYRPDTG